MRTTSIVLALSLVAAVGLFARPVNAQNVLGDGRRLDASLQAGTGGRNAPKLRNTYGLTQNSLVTGNVGGLRQFRGDVGYRAAGEFSGTLPGDLVYQFQLNAAGRDFQSYTRQNRYGREGRYSARRPAADPLSTYRRPGSGASLGEIQGYTPQSFDFASSGAGALDATRQRLSSARPDAGLSYEQNNLSIESAAMGDRMRIQPGPDKPIDTRQLFRKPIVDINPADDLSGTEGFGPTAEQADLTAVGGAEGGEADVPGRINRERFQVLAGVSLGERIGSQLTVDPASRIGVSRFTPVEATQLSESVSRLLTPPAVEGEGEGEGAAPPAGDAYQSLLDRIRAQAAAEQGQLPAGEGEGENPDGGEGEGEGDAAAPGAPASLDQIIGRIDYDLAPLRTMTGASGDFLNDAMGRAERAMTDERYFDAEIGYAEALNHRPGYPLAVVGKVHAQLGAGLFMSAGRTMRVLFSHHPELIAARYRRPLLPTTERLSQVSGQLTKLAEAQPQAAEPMLLLAYIAYQQQDAAACGAALDELTRRLPSDSLTPLLRRIWTKPTAPAAPAAAPETPAEAP